MIDTLILISNHLAAVKGFNIRFGLIGIKQAESGRFSQFPKRLFKWTGAGDTLFIVIGVGLVLIGIS